MYGLARLCGCWSSLQAVGRNHCWRLVLLSKPLGGKMPAGAPRLQTRSISMAKNVRNIRPRHVLDQVSKDFRIIYENNMHKLLFWSHIFINVFMVPVVVFSGYLIIKHRQDIPDRLNITHPALAAMCYSMFGIFILAVLTGVRQRSLIRIYHNDNTGEFVAFTRNLLMQKTRLEFTASDVSPKAPAPVLKLAYGNILINGRPFLVSGADFAIPAFYNMFCGHHLNREIETIPDLDFSDEAAELKRRIRHKLGRK